MDKVQNAKSKVKIMEPFILSVISADIIASLGRNASKLASPPH